MINPSAEDIGREAIYTNNYGGPFEIGIISSITDKYVFVRYHSGDTAAATKREDLIWPSDLKGPKTVHDRRAGVLKIMEGKTG